MAIHFKNEAEIAFFKAYFDSAHFWVNDLEEIVRIAQEESERHGPGCDGCSARSRGLSGER